MSDLRESLPEYEISGVGSFINYLCEFYLFNPQYLTLIIIAISAFYLLFRKRYKPKKIIEISEEEVETLVKNWTPQPLHQELTELQQLNINVPLISSAPTPYIKVNDKSALNLATSNYLGLVQDEHIQDSAIKALRKYGCGSCGPRGFYGTIDIHLHLEEKIAKFMGTEDAVIYSSAFATMASAIPAFAKKGDIIVVDSGISFASKVGINLSRATIKWFKHNDMQDLERVLEQMKEEHLRSKKKLTRRFLVIEGVYQNTGNIVPLDKVMQLKDKYCFRIFLDDSNGIGVLGKTGRGTCEYHGVPAKDVEFIMSSMGNTLGSTGGFCCGTKQITSHQRLNSSGYVFSASLPPYLAATAIASLEMIEKEPHRPESLRNKSNAFRKALGQFQNGLIISGEENSPITHISFPLLPDQDRTAIEITLQKLVDEALDKHNIALTRAKYLVNEEKVPNPSVLIMVSSAHTDEDLIRAASHIKELTSGLVF
jgi:serine palmitoyltransferase